MLTLKRLILYFIKNNIYLSDCEVYIESMSSRELLPSEVSRLVLSYLLENQYEDTKEVFMSECSALAELKSLTPLTLIHTTVNGRTLSKILKDYMR